MSVLALTVVVTAVTVAVTSVALAFHVAPRYYLWRDCR